jgi:hypothetical protein
MAIQKMVSHATQAIYKKSIQNMDYPSLTHVRLNAKSLSHSITSTMLQGPHRCLRYLQPKH